MVYREIVKQSTIEGVAQSVVDQICRVHKEQFVKSENQTCLRREDMTLLIRLFNVKVGDEKLQNIQSVTFFIFCALKLCLFKTTYFFLLIFLYSKIFMI